MEYAIKKEIIRFCHKLYEKGLVIALEGNVSVKIDKDYIIATPTSKCKGDLTEADLVVIDSNGKLLSKGLKPSSEIKLHLMVYKERPDINSVVHAHPPYSTAFAVAGIPLIQCILPEVVIMLGSVPLADYGTPSTSELPESVKKYIKNYKAFLLANHGAMTIGETISEAYYLMETVEHLALITLIAKSLGNTNVLSKEQVDTLLELRRKQGIKGVSASCEFCSNQCPLFTKKTNITDEEKNEIINSVILDFKKSRK